MSREAFEQSKQNWEQSEKPRGAGDPDWYGHPDEPKLPPVKPSNKTAAELMAEALNNEPF